MNEAMELVAYGFMITLSVAGIYLMIDMWKDQL